MASGSIVDLSTGTAQSIGRYFSVISVIPSSLYVAFVYLLVSSGSWRHAPDWSQAFRSLAHIGITGVGLLALFSIGLGVIIHPIQFAIVQFFEGYWGTTPIAQAIRARRIVHYQRLCETLRSARIDARTELKNLPESGAGALAIRTPAISRWDEARRIRDNFPRSTDQVMPTRLGNILRRYESQAGSQYGLDALQVVPHLLLVAPASHVDYVNDQRSQLDLAVRMTFMSVAASVTALLFLWPYGLWVLIALIPYTLAYLSYRGSVVAGGHYGSALDTLINLDRFALYEQLRVDLPPGTGNERSVNRKLMNLFRYDDAEIINYDHTKRSN